MSTAFYVERKYLESESHHPDELVQIGTRFKNGNVRNSLEQLLEVFRFVEQSFVIGLYVGRSLSSEDEVEDIVDKASSDVETAVKKLIGNQLSDDPVLLRTQSESAQEASIDSTVGNAVWGYLKSTAESYGLKKVGDLIRYIRDLASTDKPFYSRWNKESPIEFCDNPTRFSYAPIGDFEYQDAAPEDDTPNPVNAHLHFHYWDDVLDDSTPLVANDAHIRTWGDLKEALHGDNKEMDESAFMQGTFSLPLRETIRLVPSPID